MTETKGKYTVEVTTEEAAEMLKCTSRTVRNMIIRGSIQARMEKIDPNVEKGVYKIPLREIQRIKNETAVPA